MLYGAPSSRNAPSTLVYRPFESWASNSDWSLALPAGEEVECVAAGRTFSAAATSRRCLHLFSPAGLQTAVLALAGAPVALAAAGHQLAVVWHAGAPTPTGDQALHYALQDVTEQRLLHGGPLPLSPGASLAWLGFSEEGQLAAYDSEGELRLRTPDFGGSWVTAFSAAAGKLVLTGLYCKLAVQDSVLWPVWGVAPDFGWWACPRRAHSTPAPCPALPNPHHHACRAQEHGAVLGGGPVLQGAPSHRVRQQPRASGALGRCAACGDHRGSAGAGGGAGCGGGAAGGREHQVGAVPACWRRYDPI